MYYALIPRSLIEHILLYASRRIQSIYLNHSLSFFTHNQHSAQVAYVFVPIYMSIEYKGLCSVIQHTSVFYLLLLFLFCSVFISTAHRLYANRIHKFIQDIKCSAMCTYNFLTAQNEKEVVVAWSYVM